LEYYKQKILRFTLDFHKSKSFILFIFRCEDDPQIRQRQTAIQRANGYYGPFRRWKVNALKYPHRIQVSQRGGFPHDTVTVSKII